MVVKYKKALMSIGYEKFKTEQAKIAVKLLLGVLPHGTLCKRIAANLRLRKSELEKNFATFVKDCGTGAY